MLRRGESAYGGGSSGGEVPDDSDAPRTARAGLYRRGAARASGGLGRSPSKSRARGGGRPGVSGWPAIASAR
jgi:hypothetical protein